MILHTWPHGHFPHALRDFLQLGATLAGTRWYVGTTPREDRTYPLGVVSAAGLGALGVDSAIQADEIRVQVDHWAVKRLDAAALDAQTFRLLDARFSSAPRFVTWRTEDEGEPGTFYETKIERIARSGGSDPYFDEFAQKHRVTTFYVVKINL